MTMSREKLLANLHQLHKERRNLLKRLTRPHVLAIGTVSLVRRKCGNPTCHCTVGPGHPQTLFLYKDSKETRRRCKLVRREDEAWMTRAGERYREFRRDLKQLRALDHKEKQIFMALAQERAVWYE
jgi:Family of unknown function (DUF6788)